MKRNLLFILGLFAVFCLQANAEVTPQQVSEPDYMINSGYSEAVAEDVLILKNRVTGKPCEPLYEKNNNKFVRFLKNCYSYIDPAQESEQRYHHDTKLSPHWTDL